MKGSAARHAIAPELTTLRVRGELLYAIKRVRIDKAVAALPAALYLKAEVLSKTTATLI